MSDDDIIARATADLPEPPRIVARPASAFASLRVEFLTGGDWWPVGFLSVLGGKGGLGKSTMTAELAAQVTRGRAGGRFGTTPVDVFMLSAEDTIGHVLNPRLIAAGADLDRVRYVTISDTDHTTAALSIPDDLPVLEQLVDANPSPVGLVVLDPLVAFIGDQTDTHRDHDTRRALQPLADTSARLGVPVIGVMHLNKDRGGDAYSRLMASAAFYNAVRFVAIFGRDPENPDGDTRVLVCDKSNLGPNGMSRRVRIETVDLRHDDGAPIRTVRAVDEGAATVTAAELLAESTAATAPKTETACELIEELWMRASGPVDSGEIRAALEQVNRDQPRDERISWSTAKGALKKLGGVSRRRGFGSDGGWEWVPPDGYVSDP